MSGDCALGIDVGTSGVRAAILDPSGDIHVEAATRMDALGANLRDPSIWRRTLHATLTALWKDSDPACIGAVSVDGTSGTVLALDAQGAPVGDALMYNDAVQDDRIVARIASVAPRESAAHGASSGLARAMTLQDRAGVVRIVHQADWIASLFANAPVASDESNALKTGYDPVHRHWPDWIEEAGLAPQHLPEVVPAGTVTGHASGHLGVPVGALMVAGVTDGCASFLATGASAPGDGVTALGTTLTIKLLSNAPVFAPQYGIYSHRIGSRWLAGGASNTGGGVLATFFDDGTLAALSEQLDPTQPSGLDYYPLSAPGERFPISDPALPPRLDPRPADDAVFLQGMLEGMARIEADGYARLAELGAPALRSIRTVGGGATNVPWSRIRQGALGVPVARARSTSAAAGVARLALEALRQQ
ncbi:MAG: FGGY-family carbohydrate kinase [Pseudomonadota bacterium]